MDKSTPRSDRKLTLSKETLVNLSQRELEQAVGGLTGYYPTINSPCGPSINICKA